MGHASQAVSIEVIPSTDVTTHTWDEIWSLTRQLFDTERSYSEQKLKRRQRVVLVRSKRSRELVGMASIDIYPVLFHSRNLVAIHTSHVLLLEAYRGRNLLQQIGFKTFAEVRMRYPLRPIYWFFDTFSYKSYLLLPRNFREYWPRRDMPTPEWEFGLMDYLATLIYRSAWRAERGIVVGSGQKRLQPDAAPLTEKDLRSPELAFFERMNPGHAEGDMLICLCPLTLSNWIQAAANAVRRLRQK